ncbi:MAG TPA: DUF5666 domain-containing protein [Vicinamibacterales bacterium]|jgi:hypothetical protein|nr:DUF5666 domain-containing protein [Vicinamibacterales bacterium]
MRRAFIGIVAGVVAVVFTAPAALAQDTKSVRGTVTAVSGNSITVKAAGKDYTIAIDKTTEVEAPGGGTAQRAAQKAGEAGIHVADVIKVGSGVEVRYHDMGGTLHAARIRGGLPPSEGSTSEDKPDKPKSTTVSGTVTAVANDSITVSTGPSAATFAIDKNTKIIGEGVGTLSRKLKEAGKGMTATDAIGMGDHVSVTFAEAGGAKTASSINITRKGGKTE